MIEIDGVKREREKEIPCIGSYPNVHNAWSPVKKIGNT